MKRLWRNPEPPAAKRLNKSATDWLARHDPKAKYQKFIDRKRRERAARPNARIHALK